MRTSPQRIREPFWPRSIVVMPQVGRQFRLSPSRPETVQRHKSLVLPLSIPTAVLSQRPEEEALFAHTELASAV